MKTTTILCSLLVLGALARGQEESDAERFFRDGWWQETGANELGKARDAYRKAVDAAGPAAIRARALLALAEVEQRRGAHQDALAALERLVRDFADETELVAKAKARLEEWTAVDLRNSYSEWYRRYLFSPEYQKKVVEMVQDWGSVAGDGSVTSRERETELLTIGEAAVPALREVVRSRNAGLAAAATRLLLRLGTLPPADALLRDPEWSGVPEAWSSILGAPAGERGVLRNAIQNGGALAQAVRAAATHPAKLLEFATSEQGGVLAVDLPPTAAAILAALHEVPDGVLHDRMAELAVSPDVSVHVRRLLETQIAENGWGAPAGAWLAWGRRATSWNAQRAAVFWAARRLRNDDVAALDGLIGEIEGLERVELQAGMLQSLAEGLAHNPVLLQLPWTPERLYRVLVLTQRFGIDALGAVLGQIRRDPSRVGLVVDAVLLHPEVLARQMESTGGPMSSLRELDLESDEDAAILETRWARQVYAGAVRLWESWSAEQRAAFVALVRGDELIDSRWLERELPAYRGKEDVPAIVRALCPDDED